MYYVRVVDESGEDYFCPRSYFVQVQIPLHGRELLECWDRDKCWDAGIEKRCGDGFEDPSFFSMLTAGVAQIWQRLLTKVGSLDASR